MTLDGSPIALSLCQINVAIGLVYIGLREFRYKRFLTDEIWSAFTGSGCDNIDFSSLWYPDLMRDDERFAKGHHYLTRLASNLLLDKLSATWKTNLESRKSSGKKKNSGRLKWPNRTLMWYMGGPDKFMIFLFLVAFPIAMLWYNPSADDLRGWLFLGQVFVVAHIVVFWLVVKWVGRKVRMLGGYVVTQLVNAEARDLFRKFSEGLQESESKE